MRKIANIECEYYATDHWKVYRKVISKDKLRQSKKETSRIESENSRVRHYLARFHRRTHCYSKSKDMLLATLNLFFKRDFIIALLF